MQQVLTRDFGWLNSDQCVELDFPSGLPGFEQEKRFALIQQDALAPLVLLQSAMTPQVCFLTVPVQSVDPGYRIGITPEDCKTVDLGSADQIAPPSLSPTSLAKDLLCLAILSSTGEDHQITANLLAPVFVNLKTRVGVQAVRSDVQYSHQHPLPGSPVCS